MEGASLKKKKKSDLLRMECTIGYGAQAEVPLSQSLSPPVPSAASGVFGSAELLLTQRLCGFTALKQLLPPLSHGSHNPVR